MRAILRKGARIGDLAGEVAAIAAFMMAALAVAVATVRKRLV